MTMHLVRGMNTTNTKNRKTRGLTKNDREAAVAHDKWLRKMGTHPDQLKSRKKKPVNTLPFERDRSHERQGNKSPSMAQVLAAMQLLHSQKHTMVPVSCLELLLCIRAIWFLCSAKKTLLKFLRCAEVDNSA